MIIGRRSPWILGLALLVTSCNSTGIGIRNQSDLAQTELPDNCPPTEAKAIALNIEAFDFPQEAFDFTPQSIVADADTLTVTTPHRNLVFCRSTGTWSILPISEEDAAEPASDEFFDRLSDPPYAEIQLDGQTYQYRAVLKPNPFPDFEVSPERVVFELILPGETEPQTITLYTLEELLASKLAIDLGVPEVTATSTAGDRLFFVVSPEQGEGFGGLTTLVSYDVAASSLNKAQPAMIVGEQITDLVITQTDTEFILWLGTKYAAEGSPQLPAKGLVAYRIQQDNWQAGTTATYSVHNSPLIGAIPFELQVLDDNLWVATGNGICQIAWQNIAESDAWDCWRFTLEIDLPAAGLPLYKSALSEVPVTTLTQSNGDEQTLEILWWSPINRPIPDGDEAVREQHGRFEVSYQKSFMATIPEGGLRWPTQAQGRPLPEWDIQVYWPGEDWHWQGDRFVRGFDEVPANAVSFGPSGMSERGYSRTGIQDTNVLRGDVKLLSLDNEQTKIQYFSGWTEDNLIEPRFAIIPTYKTAPTEPNPLKAIAPQLKTLE